MAKHQTSAWYNENRVKQKHSVILTEWSATKSPSALRKQAELRRFEGAKSSRLTSGWQTVSTKIDGEIKLDLVALRARARDLSINDSYARKFIHMAAANVVGSNGFILQSQVNDPNGQSDSMARKAIENAYVQWCKIGNCETSGKLSFNDFCRLFTKTLARDGEVLIRRIRNRSFEFGYKLQMLDIDRLDVMHNEALSNGNTIIMGVELDAYGSPVAYHLTSRHPGETNIVTNEKFKRERVAASDIFHIFVADRAEQTRGFPWMSAALQDMKMLAGYREAAIVAARNGASKMGFFTSPDGTAGALADGQDAEGNFTTSADAGTFDVIPSGYTFQQYNPEYPTQNFDSFVKSCIRSISSGLGVAYNALANDLENVNFSSIRAGVLEERESWMMLQNHMIEAFLRPMFDDWLEAAILKNKLIMPNGSSLPSGKLDKFRSHTWQGRRWQWVDPLKDIEASVTAIKAGLSTPQIVAAQMGLDIEDVIDALAQANMMAEAAGLPSYSPQPEPATPPTTTQTDPAADTSKALLAAIAARSLEQPQAPSVNVKVGIDNDQMSEMAREIQSVAKETLEQIREDVQNMPIVIPAPVVNIEAPNVTVNNNVEPTPVTLEANIQPADVTVSLPARMTETTTRRDANGELIGSISIEKDYE